MARAKTKAEKIRSSRRRKRMAKQRVKSVARRSSESFSYLSKEYVKKDLTKTVVFSVLIVVVELVLARVL